MIVEFKHGTKPVRRDHRDYSFHRTFGAIPGAELPDKLDLDAGFPARSQNEDGLPNGCTGYTQSAIGADEDKTIYNARYTYDKTLEMMGVDKNSPEWETVGCDMRTSLSSTIVYGLDDGQHDPLTHRRGAYYAVEQFEHDWFDSLRQTMLISKRPISIATPFFPEFMQTEGGIVKAPYVYNTDLATRHNWIIHGWETFNGVSYLKAEAWIGPQWGINGRAYFPREVINTLLSLPGAAAFTLAPFTGANVQNVQLTLWQTVLSYCRMMVKLLS